MSKGNNGSTIEPTLQQQTINTSVNIDANQKYGFIMGKLHTNFQHLHIEFLFLKLNIKFEFQNGLQVNEKIR